MVIKLVSRLLMPILFTFSFSNVKAICFTCDDHEAEKFLRVFGNDKFGPDGKPLSSDGLGITKFLESLGKGLNNIFDGKVGGDGEVTTFSGVVNNLPQIDLEPKHQVDPNCKAYIKRVAEFSAAAVPDYASCQAEVGRLEVVATQFGVYENDVNTENLFEGLKIFLKEKEKEKEKEKRKKVKNSNCVQQIDPDTIKKHIGKMKKAVKSCKGGYCEDAANMCDGYLNQIKADAAKSGCNNTAEMSALFHVVNKIGRNARIEGNNKFVNDYNKLEKKQKEEYDSSLNKFFVVLNKLAVHEYAKAAGKKDLTCDDADDEEEPEY